MSTEEEDYDEYFFSDYFSADRALTVREEHSVAEIVNRETKNHIAAEGVWMAVTWMIAHDPEKGTPILGTSPLRRLLKLMPIEIAGTPGIMARYYVEGHVAVVDWVKFYPHRKGMGVSPAAYVYSSKGKVRDNKGK